jgi:hypothetical protein
MWEIKTVWLRWHVLEMHCRTVSLNLQGTMLTGQLRTGATGLQIVRGRAALRTTPVHPAKGIPAAARSSELTSAMI